MIDSYHAHIYFSPGPEAERARKLLDAVASTFDERVAIGRFHEKPIGPHPRGSCQLSVTVEDSADVLRWLLENRNGLTVFMHGNSGDNLADHTSHVAWLGESETLKLSVFTSKS